MNIYVVIFARMDSKRLPGKALLDLVGKPVLDYILDRAKLIKTNKIIIATSSRNIDDPLEKFAISRGIDCYRGPFENVLRRALLCSIKISADAIIRVCGDSPFFSVELVNQAIEIMQKKSPDIVTTNYPRSWPIGTSVELVKKDSLKNISKFATDDEREHILNYAYKNPTKYKIINIDNKNKNERTINLSLDDKEGYMKAEWLIKNFSKKAEVTKLDEIIKLNNNFLNRINED